jgi:AAHS family 4-hydroxybenzoate transporter-like MFS transporter
MTTGNTTCHTVRPTMEIDENIQLPNQEDMPMKTVDVGQILDEGRWSAYQKLLIFGTALTIILDGIDNQLLSYAVPHMATDWSIDDLKKFGTVQFVGPIGMLFGGLFGGMLGDRIGRRSALLLSVIAFAALTLAISAVNGIGMLALLRFLAGLGLGGAMPNAAALSSEYVPKRKRAFAVTLTIVCIPLGGFLAASLSGIVLPDYGWRALFLVGGIIPIILALILFKVLPESPRYLASQRKRWPELVVLLNRLGHSLPPDVAFAESKVAETGKSIQKASIRDLFVPAFRLDTLGLFGAFFFCLLANYVGIFWLPSMLTKLGFMATYPTTAGKYWNFGGVFGALFGAFLIQRLGSRIPMLGMSALSIVCAVVLALMRIDPSGASVLMVMLVLLGGLMNAVQTTMYALAANVYPTSIRGTGIGTAVAVGRIGNAMAGYVGPSAIAIGSYAYFGSFAVTMALTLGSLAIIRRHIERN